MKKIIVYVKEGSKSDVFKFDNLKDGHNKFRKIHIKGNFNYLELGIDEIDLKGTYRVIRSLSK